MIPDKGQPLTREEAARLREKLKPRALPEYMKKKSREHFCLDCAMFVSHHDLSGVRNEDALMHGECRRHAPGSEGFGQTFGGKYCGEFVHGSA